MCKINNFSKNIQSDSQCQYFEIDEVLARIKRGNNRHLIEKIRNEPNKAKRDTLKKQLFWICFSGKFRVRSNDAMLQHSGFICLDFDNIPAREMQMWRNRIRKCEYTYALFTSPSGNGLKAIWKIPECKTNDEHNARFESIAWYYKECQYFDKNVKGWNRVCFESYDPEIYINHDSQLFDGIVKREEHKPQPVRADDDVEADTIKLVEQIEQKQIDITYNYEDWLNIGFGLAEKFDERGRELYHRISKVSPKYKSSDCDKQYDACLKGRRTGITINTLFHLCKQNEILISDGTGEATPQR